MRILLIEDDQALASYVSDMLTQCLPGRDVMLASDRSTACSQVDATDDLELVVCDLRIPSGVGTADADEAHGKAVQAYLALHRPGVPCVFLSGYARDHIKSLVSSAALGGTARVSPGDDVVQLVQLAEKDDLLDFREKVERLREVIAGVEAHQVESDDELPTMDIRILQLALANQDVDRGRAVAIGGGMAGGRAYRLDGLAKNDVVTAQLFVKIDRADEVRDELRRYELNVPGRLKPGDYATFVAHMQWFSGGGQALVFRFSDHVSGSVFDALEQDGTVHVAAIRGTLHPWSTAGGTRNLSISALRRRWVSDEVCRDAGLLGRTDVISLESSSVDVAHCCAHGDMHGDNALVSGDSVCLIDFGDVGESVACLDALTLELSLWTHERGRQIARGWPSADQARHWWDGKVYIDGCPFPGFVEACREWALAAVNGNEAALVATMYAHSARQLRYPDVPIDIAMAFMDGSVARWAELHS